MSADHDMPVLSAPLRGTEVPGSDLEARLFLEGP